MLPMTLGRIIHQERQQEIERTLERRRLLAQAPKEPARPAVATGTCLPARHERAGAAS